MISNDVALVSSTFGPAKGSVLIACGRYCIMYTYCARQILEKRFERAWIFEMQIEKETATGPT